MVDALELRHDDRAHPPARLRPDLRVGQLGLAPDALTIVLDQSVRTSPLGDVAGALAAPAEEDRPLREAEPPQHRLIPGDARRVPVGAQVDDLRALLLPGP